MKPNRRITTATLALGLLVGCQSTPDPVPATDQAIPATSEVSADDISEGAAAQCPQAAQLTHIRGKRCVRLSGDATAYGYITRNLAANPQHEAPLQDGVLPLNPTILRIPITAHGPFRAKVTVASSATAGVAIAKDYCVGAYDGENSGDAAARLWRIQDGSDDDSRFCGAIQLRSAQDVLGVGLGHVLLHPGDVVIVTLAGEVDSHRHELVLRVAQDQQAKLTAQYFEN